MVMWGFPTGGVGSFSGHWKVVEGISKMVTTGGGTVTTGLIAGVAHACSPPPMEFVFQAVSPVVTGKVIQRLAQVDQAMAVGVRHAWGMVFRNAQLMSAPVWAAR